MSNQPPSGKKLLPLAGGISATTWNVSSFQREYKRIVADVAAGFGAIILKGTEVEAVMVPPDAYNAWAKVVNAQETR